LRQSKASELADVALKVTMPKKVKARNNGNAKRPDSLSGVWVNPNLSLKGANGERAWDNRRGGLPNSSRFLELADIALGLKKPSPREALRRSVHETTKKDPYSG
jgi:hypothetical protein